MRELSTDEQKAVDGGNGVETALAINHPQPVGISEDFSLEQLVKVLSIGAWAQAPSQNH